MGGEALISGLDLVPQIAGGVAVPAAPVVALTGGGVARVWLPTRNAFPVGLGIALGLLALGAAWWFEVVPVPEGIRKLVA